MPPLRLTAALVSIAALSANTAATEPLRINQLQGIGTHNSYKRAIEPELMELLLALNPDMVELDYSHRSLTEQLGAGLTSLEIDLHNDPEGGLYAQPKGLELLRSQGITTSPYDPEGLMRRPGFKVLHVADVDFRSCHFLFEDTLAELRAWSEKHPRSPPIIVTMNLNDEARSFPGATVPAEFDASALDALDNLIRRSLGEERLITPDLVRGDADSLEKAVRENGWPELDDVRGRFLWVIDEGGSKHNLYVEGHESLRGRAMFTSGPTGQPEAAFLIINDPISQAEEITRRVKQGYLVRTRADAGTHEARKNDDSRFEAAKRSGAHVISTDYPWPDERFETGYQVRFDQGYSRPNPLTAPAASTEAVR